MNELVAMGIGLVVTSALLYGLAIVIQRKQWYFLIAGWRAEKITDHDACGRLICKGLKGFAVVIGCFSIPSFLGFYSSPIFEILLVVLPLVPLFYYGFQANKRYVK